MRRIAVFVLLLTACASHRDADWPAYARDGGTRYSPLTSIDRTNVGTLAVAWTYHTHEPVDGTNAARKSTFEATPIVVDGVMYVSTGMNRVIALDAATGAERWVFDPKVNPNGDYSEVTSRGVGLWRGSGRGTCAQRVFTATIDARLIAIDAATGARCSDFGTNGEVDLTRGIEIKSRDDFQVTSAPAIIGDLVITGSAIGDNSRVELERGVVRAFDVHTGAQRWSWDPLRPDPAMHSGAANAWSTITPDPESGLVFVPTSSPSPDYYGGFRLGDNADANSVVALRARDGSVAWRFQVVHHDLWDYDVATQPVLVDVGTTKAVAVGTKMGHLFLLDRMTGKPLFPVEERPVPASDIPGERASATQPFPTAPPPLVQSRFTADDAWGLTDEDRDACRTLIASLRNEGIFTPPSTRGSLQAPSNIGGMHWGGMSYDPVRHLLFANVNRLAAMVRLIPGDQYDDVRKNMPEGERVFGEFNRMRGAPYGMFRSIILSPHGVPCTPPPWGTLIAIDVDRGAKRWEVPFGTIDRFPTSAHLIGSPNLGGSMTANGIIFIGAAMDTTFRAFDAESGRELWHAELPASAQASPMAYRAGGREFVAIAAGGHGKLHTKRGDEIVAFALPR